MLYRQQVATPSVIDETYDDGILCYRDVAITSAKKGMLYLAFVCFVGLFVCLLATLRKTTNHTFMKISQEMLDTSMYKEFWK